MNSDADMYASLYISDWNILETWYTHETGSSSLHNFRSDNPDAVIGPESTPLIHGVFSGSEIKFNNLFSNDNFETEGYASWTKLIELVN